MVTHLTGLISAPLTPFKHDGSVNLDIIGSYAEFLARNNVKGVFVNGTTGESLLLGLEERKLLAAKWVEVAPKDLKVMIHIGHTSIVDAKILAKHAEDIGAYAIGAMGPMYLRPPNLESLVKHCAMEASAAPNLPYYYYHIPKVSFVDFSMIDYIRLAEEQIPNFTGIKFSNIDPYGYGLCLNYRNKKFDILWGSDENLLPALAIGAQGAVGSTYNFIAPIFNDIISAYIQGNMNDAQGLALTTMQMVQTIFKSGAFHSFLKSIMRKLGLDLGPVRSPLIECDLKVEARLLRELELLGFNDYCCK